MKKRNYFLAAGNAGSRSALRPCRWLAFLAAMSTGMLLSAAAPQLPPVTTVSGSPRLPIWADHVTSDVEPARKFYGLIAMMTDATAELFNRACFSYSTLSNLYKYAAYDAILLKHKLGQS